MSLIVMKFGGTSVGSIERIKNVARIVAKKKDEGHDVIVAASAMSGETDRLIGLLKEISPDYSPREYDQLVSTGETASVPLLAQALLSLGYDAKSFTGLQVGMQTDGTHTKARIKKVTGEKLKKALADGTICVVAGFQGYNPDTGDITTLGRGGSDTTAVAIAAAMNADVCEIYTDVDGVYTADPRIVKNAKKLDTISHEEMLELASLGAKVLQSRSVELGMNFNVDIMVLSSLEDKPGTLVTSKEDEEMERIVVSGVTSDKNQAKITILGVPDKPGTAAGIFMGLAKANINVDMIIQNVAQEGRTDISFTVPQTDLVKTMSACRSVSEKAGARDIVSDENISKVSVVGIGMKSHSGVAANMFKALSDSNINIKMISTSEIKVSCVIEEKFTELAVRVLHDTFISEKR